MKITTGTGDNGTTDLYSERVDKCCDIVELLGTLDETASVISVCRSLINDEVIEKELSDVILTITKIASFVCKRENALVDKEREFLEDRISFYEKNTPEIKLFEYPSKKISAVMDYARCVVRRTERCAVRCKMDISYLNRLSDYLFVLSRYTEYGEKI